MNDSIRSAMQIQRQVGLIFALFLSLLVAGCSPIVSPDTPDVPATESITLKINIQPFMGYAPFLIAKEEGYFEKYGINVEFVEAPSSEAIPLTMVGELDMSAAVLNAGLFNALARGGSARVVMGLSRWSAGGCTPVAILGRTELLEQLQDMRNWNSLASASDRTDFLGYFLDQTLAQGGLTLANVETSRLPAPAALEALETGAVQLLMTAEPWIARVVNSGSGAILRKAQEVLPDSQFSVVLFGDRLLKSPELAQRVTLAYLDAVQQYQQGPTDRNIEILARYTKLEPDLLRNICWASIPADGSINIDSIMGYQEWAVEQGLLDSILDPDEFWDGRILDELKTQ
jgi:NitT/TauT family transport system substrate-binding protein